MTEAKTKRKPGRPKKVRKTPEQDILAVNKGVRNTPEQQILAVDAYNADMAIKLLKEKEEKKAVVVQETLETLAGVEDKPKPEPQLYRAYVVERDMMGNWFALRIWLDRETNTVVKKEKLFPNGTTRPNAIVALTSYVLEMRNGTPYEYIVRD